jgi:UTP--glucose-1-phosphate uridylyltransferase
MTVSKKVTKAVLPVAGLGTRFLPGTKAVPKEMLNIVDKPVVQYVVEEAIAAGIEHFVFVTGRNKNVIEDHFDIQYELNDTLRKRGKTKELDMLNAMLPAAGRTSFTRQQEPLGLGHAVWCARDIIRDEPFALLLPDMVMQDKRGCMSGMMDLYNKTGGNIISVEEVAVEDAHNYGVVGVGEELDGGFEITGMVEKPAKGTEPSNLFINGRYILQPEIFDILETQERGAGNEIQITDAMLKLADEQKFSGYRFNGNTYDCGTKQGFLLANIVHALERDDIRDTVLEDIRKLVQ